jgi:hypothetical protein
MYVQAMIEEYLLDKCITAYDQPHLMGPIGFIFNDLERIKPVEKLERNLRGCIKKMLEKDRGDGKKWSTGY